MADLLTDDMDIRDTTLSMDVGGNGDYYLSLKETKRGKIIKLDTRIAMSGGNATTEVKKAIADLYKALQGEQVSSVLQANEILPLVSERTLGINSCAELIKSMPTDQAIQIMKSDITGQPPTVVIEGELVVAYVR